MTELCREATRPFVLVLGSNPEILTESHAILDSHAEIVTAPNSKQALERLAEFEKQRALALCLIVSCTYDSGVSYPEAISFIDYVQGSTSKSPIIAFSDFWGQEMLTAGCDYHINRWDYSRMLPYYLSFITGKPPIPQALAA